MALQISDRVKEQAIVTGTGPVTMPGSALFGYQTFGTTTTPGNTTWYTIYDPIDGTWEVGLGSWNGTQLTRTTVYSSSNGGAVINFAGHLCDIFQDVPANQVNSTTLAANSVLANTGTISAAGQSLTIGGPLSDGPFVGSAGNLVSTAPTTYYLVGTPDGSGFVATTIVGASPYYSAVRTPTSSAAFNIPGVVTGTGSNNFANFITPPGDAGAVAFTAGNVKLLIYAQVSDPTAVANITVLIRKRAPDGTETNILTCTSANFSNTLVTGLDVKGEKFAATAMGPYDRLIFRVQAARVSGPSSFTVTFTSDGIGSRSTGSTTITGTGTPGPQYGDYNIRVLGGFADALTYTDGLISAGSNVLTSTSATFGSQDIGKPIWVTGAGVGGLSGAPFATTIASVTNSHTIVCAGTADTATSGVQTLVGAVIDVPGSSGYYLPGVDTIAVVGGTASVTAVLSVASTAVNPPTDTTPALQIVSAGSGGIPGTWVFESTTQTGAPFRARVNIDSTGTATSILLISGGIFVSNPGTSAEPLVNLDSNLTGLTVSVTSIGVRSVTINTTGAYTVIPSDPFATGAGSSSGAIGCTLDGSWSGSGQFLYGTNARTALAAALTQAIADQAVTRVIVSIPAGNYLLDGAALPIMTKPVWITGDGPNQTNILVAPTYAGPHVFGWSDLFGAITVSPSIGLVGAPTQSLSGGGLENITIAANRSSSVRQHGIICYGRIDSLALSNIRMQFLNGSALWTGPFGAALNGFLRESTTDNLYFRNCGDNGFPVVNLDSTGTSAGDNFLRLTNTNIVFPVGPGMAITNHTTKRFGVKTIYINGLRIERNSQLAYGDLLQIGSTTDLNAVSNVYGSDIHLVAAGSGVSALALYGRTATTRPQDIDLSGLLINGPVLGTGVSIFAGRNIYIRAAQIEGRTASIASGNHTSYVKITTAVAGSTPSTVATVIVPNGANVGAAAVMTVPARVVLSQTGTLATVASVISGRLLTGSYITTNNFGAENVVSFGSGTGGTGTYNMSVSQTIAAGTTVDLNYFDSRNVISSSGSISTIDTLQGSASTWANVPASGDVIAFEPLIDADILIDGDGQEASYTYALGSGVSALVSSPLLALGQPDGPGTVTRDLTFPGTVALPSAIITGGTIDGLNLTGMAPGSLVYSSGTATLANVALGSHLTITSGTLDVSGFGTGSVTSVIGGAGLTGGTITTTGTLAVTAATTAALGGVIVGSNISVTGGTISVAAPGTGTVTSIAETFTGGLITVTGSPITGSGTLALTVAGASGGIVYFNSGTSWASSGALTQHGVMVGSGAGGSPVSIAVGTSGQALISAGSTADPAFGVLGVTGGGNGLTAWTTGTLVYASGTTTLAGLAVGTNLAISSGTLNASGGISSIVAGTGLTGGTITTTGTVAVAAATTAAIGGVIIGSNIIVNSGTISAGSPGLAWQTGRFYSVCTPQGSGAASSKVCASPIIVPNDITAVSLSLFCGSSTGSNINVYLGVYADSGGVPGTKLAATPLISYASGTTGAQTGAISLAMKAGTVYWLVSSLGAALNCTYLAQPSGSENYGANPIAGMIGATTVAAMLGQAVTGLYASDTPGVLPTTLSGLTVNNNAFTQPVVVIGT